MNRPAWQRDGLLSDWRPRTLRQKQTLFLACISELVGEVEYHGWELTPSDFAVDEERIRKVVRHCTQAELQLIIGHRLGGCHSMKIAGDLNLFIKGRIKTTHCPEWDVLGKHWKSLHSLCRWGGDFASKDYNHFSITHGGRS